MKNLLFFFTFISVFASQQLIRAQSQPLFDEIRLTQAIDAYGVTGKGTILAVLDRGIDYRHEDFIKPDGTTRILYIWDLSDETGANDPDNSFGKGTFYDQAEINQALTSGTLLATRDASGHGTVTAGIAGGDGSGSTLGTKGIAPEADLIIIKITSEGAPAHGNQPAEAPFNRIDDSLEDAIDFISGVADDIGKPVSMIANFGSIQGPMDGSSAISRMLDSKVGPGMPGKVFVCGSSDDGALNNHAGGSFVQGDFIDLIISKRTANVRLDMWYSESDDIQFEIFGPNGSSGLLDLVSTPTGDVRSFTSEYNYFNLGSDVDFFQSTNPRRELLIDFFATGNATYAIRMHGVSVNDGRFDAILNPSNIVGSGNNEFLNQIDPGYTIWDLASAQHNICPNSYVFQSYTDINGNLITPVGHDNGNGSLWTGSGIGPTQDGRIGIDVSVPGNVNIGAFAPESFFATFSSSITEHTDEMYGVLWAVSGANPVLAGVISLMLEIDPTLTATEIKSILQSTARSDSFTGSVPNNTWGYGKLDAFAALQKVSECPQSRDLTLPHNTSVDINAATEISSSAVVNAPHTVRYLAKNEIRLVKNFQANQASIFEAILDDCSN